MCPIGSTRDRFQKPGWLGCLLFDSHTTQFTRKGPCSCNRPTPRNTRSSLPSGAKVHPFKVDLLARPSIDDIAPHCKPRSAPQSRRLSLRLLNGISQIILVANSPSGSSTVSRMRSCVRIVFPATRSDRHPRMALWPTWTKYGLKPAFCSSATVLAPVLSGQSTRMPQRPKARASAATSAAKACRLRF